MKMTDIINEIDTSKGNEDWINIEDLASREFDLPLDMVEDQDRLKAYWIANWYCTDSWVGYRLYFLDGDAVAMSYQRGREYGQEFSWFSRSAYESVRNYLISLLSTSGDQNVCLQDMNEELGDHYHIEFNSQLLLQHNLPRYNGVPVSIVELLKDTPSYGIYHHVVINIDGERKEVDLRDVEFGFYLKTR